MAASFERGLDEGSSCRPWAGVPVIVVRSVYVRLPVGDGQSSTLTALAAASYLLRMTSRRGWLAAASCLTVATASMTASSTAQAAPAEHQRCSSGAHTLSHYGDQVYPETG